MSRSALRADLGVIADLIQPGEKVLDLGCGDGSLLRHLIETKHIVGRGVEIAEPKVLACVRHGVAVRQGDLHEELRDYPENAFDTVILSYGLPYLNDPAFIVSSMLRVGRRAIVSFPNWGHWRCRLNLLLAGRMPAAPGDPKPWDEAPRARPDHRRFHNVLRGAGRANCHGRVSARGAARARSLRYQSARDMGDL